MVAYLWYVKSGALWEGFISSWTLLLAHEGSHAVQPEQSHRHETTSLGKSPIIVVTELIMTLSLESRC